jgi:DNA-binding protein H-NS
MNTTSEIQNQIELAEAQIRQLREKLQVQKAEERRAAIASIKALVKTHQFTASELGLSSGSNQKSKPAARSPNLGSKVAAKYRDPASGKTWTGRGKTPTWLATHIASGRSKDEFAV